MEEVADGPDPYKDWMKQLQDNGRDREYRVVERSKLLVQLELLTAKMLALDLFDREVELDMYHKLGGMEPWPVREGDQQYAVGDRVKIHVKDRYRGMTGTLVSRRGRMHWNLRLDIDDRPIYKMETTFYRFQAEPSSGAF